MTHLYGQAGTENSLNSIRQARLLAVFTILTVIFVSILTPVYRLKIGLTLIQCSHPYLSHWECFHSR